MQSQTKKHNPTRTVEDQGSTITKNRNKAKPILKFHAHTPKKHGNLHR